jgi:hypothetical protein
MAAVIGAAHATASPELAGETLDNMTRSALLYCGPPPEDQ